MRKAAVVIGVDRTGGLTELQSAAKGAREVAAWLEGEGYDVACLTDQKRAKVTAEKVFKAVGRFVGLPVRYGLLVVYFSGHGSWQLRNDQWLLSGAPNAPSEAIDLTASIDLAKFSGIPNVVFVSDACRTLPDTRTGAWVRGVPAFPNLPEFTQETTKVDVFKATGEARPAWEAKVGDRVQSVLTAALMAAYAEPDADMVVRIDDDGDAVDVVPNRRLEGFLQRRVDHLLEIAEAREGQVISVSVPSQDTTWIARVRRGAVTSPPAQPPRTLARGSGPALRGAAQPPMAAPRLDPVRAARDAVGGLLSTRGLRSAGGGDALALARLDPDTADHIARLSGSDAGRRGRSVSEASVSLGSDLAMFVAHEAAIERVVALTALPSTPMATLCGLQFADGRGCLLPALRGLDCHVWFNADGIEQVAWMPRAIGTDADAGLRALLSLALLDEAAPALRAREHASLAERVRAVVSVDPTLALYAALACSRDGDQAGIAGIREAVRARLGVELLDLAVLASRTPFSDVPTDVPMLPPCPMLTATWSLLATRGVQLPPAFAEAPRWLGNGLWTTFQPGYARHVVEAMEAMERGALA